MSHLKLVVEFADTRYPYSCIESLGLPYDGEYREHFKSEIAQSLHVIDSAKPDVKVVEGFRSFQLYFKKGYDFKHYRDYTKHKTSGATLAFAFNYSDKAETGLFSDMTSVRGWIKDAMHKATLPKGTKLEINPDKKAVVVLTPDIRSFFSIWRNIPQDQRTKLIPEQALQAVL